MAEQIVKTEYSEVMQKSYIDYSMSVITARALPDRSMYSYVRLSIDRCTATYV